MITGLYAGLCGLMLAVLIIRIILKRRKYRVGIGDGGIMDLSRAIRVHGNFTEFVPIMLIIIALIEADGAPPWLIHIFGCGLVVSRALHAYGITSSHLLSFGRSTGIFLTLLLLILGSLYLVLDYLF